MALIYQVAEVKEDELSVEAVNKIIRDVNRALLYLQHQVQKGQK